MSSTRRALAYTFSSQYLVIAIQFAATVVIARLLTPAEIGIFSVGAALVGLGHLLRDFGSGQYIVQEKELTPQRIRAAFSVTLILGWSIALALLAAGPFVAVFYNEPAVKNVLWLLALNFVLLPFGSITLAHFQREMDFRPAALVNIASTVVQAGISVLLAYMGYSYLSLAWGSLAGTIATITVVGAMRPTGLPALPGFREIGRVFRFGGKASLITVLAEIANVAPELALGKTQGFDAVGLFSRAQGVISIFRRLIMRGIVPVVGPAFSQKQRDGKDLASAFSYATTCVTGLAWVFYANLALLASPFILTLYGPNWTDAVPLLQMWCVAAIIGHATSLVERIFNNIGEIDRMVRVSLILHPLRIVAIIPAATVGLEAIGVALIVTSLLRVALIWPHLVAVLGWTPRDIGKVVLLSGMPSAISALSTWATYVAMGELGLVLPAALLSVSALAGALAWAFSIHILRHPLATELRSLVRRALH
jgi:O-antigen/teichoic acid export membrane protein